MKPLNCWHELAISVPACGGYGLPTAYFLWQACGISIERSAWGKWLKLRHGWCGWIFRATFTGTPAFIVFHPWFVLRVLVPFLEVINTI